jgi:uncharacterized protein (TIGR03083 family)
MGEWNATTYEGKATILRVVRQEADGFMKLAERPDAWEAPTACRGWSTRDVVGHLVDTTEGYFVAFDAARATGPTGSSYGVLGMGERANKQAQSFRGVPQQELTGRLRADFDKMMGILDPLGPDEWTGMMVDHFYMGTVPAFFYSAGQLMDYAVHSWDMREGTGSAHGLGGEAADLLVPFMFAIWQSTIRPDADLTPFQLGIRVTSGHNAGDYRMSVGEGGMTYEMAPIDDLATTIEFDAGSLVLTTFGRCNSGTVRGDPLVADRYLNLFFRI